MRHELAGQQVLDQAEPCAMGRTDAESAARRVSHSPAIRDDRQRSSVRLFSHASKADSAKIAGSYSANWQWPGGGYTATTTRAG
jgi:hypothetical protein